MDWQIDKRWQEKTYYTEQVFNNCTYHLEIFIIERYKSNVYWVRLSSGKKRKEIDVFDIKDKKSVGGVKALFWAREALYNFIHTHKFKSKKNLICIAWADNRRRNIYEKYLPDFKYESIEGIKVLVKRVCNKN